VQEPNRPADKGLACPGLLAHVLVADHPINRIEELLPWNIFPTASAEVEAA
jgi:hypothetical protein